MYAHREERSVEKICYEKEHINKNLKLIKENFEIYFNQFIEAAKGRTEKEEKLIEWGKKIGVEVNIRDENDIRKKYELSIFESIFEFEKDRQKYREIMNKENLEIYKEDVKYFKSVVLKNECPIIHYTLQNKKAKALDKYRRDFNLTTPEELLRVVTELNRFLGEYVETYNKHKLINIEDYKELGLDELDTEEYTAYGVIGGGIKSHMLYKINPEMFANRSREAIWALWYLTNKQVEDCIMDSEFLMIDTEKSITQQNYFYPYNLFSFYALNIFYLLNEKAIQNNIEIPIQYRYVIVDTFMSFVAKQHADEIETYIRNIGEDGFYGN